MLLWQIGWGGGAQMKFDLLPLNRVFVYYIFGVKLSASVLQSAKLDQIAAQGAQRRAVIKELCNYRPTTATGGRE